MIGKYKCYPRANKLPNHCESGGKSREVMITSHGAIAPSPICFESKVITTHTEWVIKRVITLRKESDSMKGNSEAIRTAQYYDMQTTFEELYKISCEGGINKDLYSLIVSPNNLKLAYRNIKANKGSMTIGVDKKSVQFLKEMNEDEFVTYIQQKLENYQPSPVRRVYIPKPNGKQRPLGIPSIVDRICQQAIRQILEPICEAKFNKHSHGFRPLLGTETAIQDVYNRIQRSHCHWAISIDIKSFFDNVNHRRLRQALWGIGVRDTRVLQILQKCLRQKL